MTHPADDLSFSTKKQPKTQTEKFCVKKICGVIVAILQQIVLSA
jgi:hypothetical protein